MTLNKLTKILLTVSLAVFLFGSGYKLGEYKTAISKVERPNYNIINAPVGEQKQNQKNLDFSVFWDAWDKLEQKFVDKKKLEPQKMFYAAIKGMVSSVDDPYTFFLTPDENKQSKEDLGGKLQGIGAQLGLKDSQIVVIAPLKKSPAELAGVKAGDIILKVNNQSTEKWTLPYAVSKIRGPKGSEVKLTLLREEKQIVVEIIREEIKVPSIELSYEKERAILKLNRFIDDTNNEWDRAISEIVQKWQDKKIVGLVLDLRDNPGGYLQGAVYVLSEFLPYGKLVVKQEYSDGSTEQYTVNRNGKLINIPLVILINKGSASASEIVAGALRDYKRAKLIGEKSFGKGSIQEALDLKENAGLHVTIAKWILPKGDWINGKGIEPEIKIENKIKEGNTPTREDDLQLEKAIEEVLK
jgi:carboxyl-terminal processing protease